MYTQGGKWKHEGEAWTHWCDGFLPGILWLVHLRTQDPWFREQAERYSRPLEPRKHDRNVHDLGFIFMSTYHHWHRLTGDPELREVLVQAGQTMGLRFKETGRYLSSFVAPESLFIDIMMNVGIIFYAARETRDERLLRTVLEHCLTTRRVLVRADGSTAHEGIFDLKTGEFLRQTTHQGFRGDSCWSRGLTWSLYGFGIAYRYTRDRRFLEAAELNADFYIEQTPRDGVPPWDYDAPAEDRGARAARQQCRRHRGVRAPGPLRLHRVPGEGAPLPRHGAAHPGDVEWARVSGESDAGVGGHPAAGRLPHSEAAGDRRIGDVGRVLLRGGAAQGADAARGIAGAERHDPIGGQSISCSVSRSADLPLSLSVLAVLGALAFTRKAGGV
jgi:hypothetical protein